MAETIDRGTILRKTHWGTDIYSHILRIEYPEDEIVMHITGRDCGIIRNPFAGGSRTLKVWFDKNDPDAKLSDCTARHHDNSGTIPDGDALDFAERYYRQSGQELLNTIERELYLHLSDRHHLAKGPRFSFFKAPISNTKPHKDITISDVYNYIVGPYAKEQTEQLRSFTDKTRAKNYKIAHFDYATFSGTFEIRSNNKVKTESGLLCVDFDHVPALETLFTRLLEDKYFTTVLLFRSPSGDGLKWVIEIDRGDYPHAQFTKAVENYISQTYGVEADQSCKDISRACFLPYDPNAFINPNFR